MRIERYPKIDVRGKIFLDYANSKCEIIYFSNGIVWNSTKDILYRLSDKFEDYIRKLFPEPKNDEY